MSERVLAERALPTAVFGPVLLVQPSDEFYRRNLGEHIGCRQARVGTFVIKAGRTTQVTVGVVIAVNATVVVGYGAAGTGLFRHDDWCHDRNRRKLQ